MPKVIKAHPAVLEYDKLENTYTRLVRKRENLEWCISYYKMRTTMIAEHHGLDEDDLINQWIKWQREVKLQSAQI